MFVCIDKNDGWSSKFYMKMSFLKRELYIEAFAVLIKMKSLLYLILIFTVAEKSLRVINNATEIWIISL